MVVFKAIAAILLICAIIGCAKKPMTRDLKDIRKHTRYGI